MDDNDQTEGTPECDAEDAEQTKRRVHHETDHLKQKKDKMGCWREVNDEKGNEPQNE